jgi:WD40 repeat protein
MLLAATLMIVLGHVAGGQDKEKDKEKDKPKEKEVKVDVRDFNGHYGTVRGVSFSPDGKTLASTGLDNYMRIWNVGTGKQERSFSVYNWGTSVTYSPDGKDLITTSNDRSVRIWDPTGTLRRTFNNHVNMSYMAAVSPNGKLAVSCAHETQVRVWDYTNCRELRNFKADDSYAVWAVAFSPDGKYVATAGQDKSVRLFNPDTGDEVRRFAGHTDVVNTVAFAPDGRSLISAGNDKVLRMWEISTGKERMKLEGHTNYVRSVVYSRDGRTIASGGYDNVIRLWDAYTGKELRKLEGHKQSVWCLAFAPGDKYLASGSDDRLVKVWTVDKLTGRKAAAAAKLTEKQVAAAWKNLEGDDGAKAFKAIIDLSGDPDSAIALLKEKLKAVSDLDDEGQKKVKALIADLDNEEFATRKKAMDALTALGAPVAPQLKAAVTKTSDIDVKLRLFVVLRQLEGSTLSPGQIRTLRALETLERIASADAKEVLTGLTKGVAEAWLTKEAKASLARITPRKPKKK